jgi:hypothetical protein
MKKILLVASLIMGVTTVGYAHDNSGSTSTNDSSEYGSDSSSYTGSTSTSDSEHFSDKSNPENIGTAGEVSPSQPDALDSSYTKDEDMSSDTGATTTTTETTETTQTNKTQAEPEKKDEKELSKGGFYIEPLIYASQNDGDAKINGADQSSTLNEAGLGLKIGGHVSQIFTLGLDGRYGRTKADNGTFEDKNADHYDYGITAGLQTPWYGVRIFGTGILGGGLNPEAGANGVDVNYTGAEGYRVGAGVFFKAVSLNLEYQDVRYKDVDIQNAGTGTPVTSADASQTGYGLSLGFPIEL